MVDEPPRYAESLGRFLGAQRWSGARGEPVTDVRIEALIPIDFAAATIAVVAARVGERAVRYQMVLDATGALAQSSIDGTADAAFRLGLAHAMARGARWNGGGATLIAEPEARADETLATVRGSALGSAEQSNTSIIYDDVAIVKLFRRLEPGTHPDVEMTAFLSRHRFPHVPALLATLRLEQAGGSSVAGMAQRLISGAGDAWAHAVASARGAVAADASADDFVVFATQLGTVTRAMHDTLASDVVDPSFAPRAADQASVARWSAAARRSMEQGIALLTERGIGEGADIASRGAGPFAAALERVVALVGHDAGAEIRHHGDYHLGQVLRGPDGALYVIDFEGEPARPLDERRARHCALRDVAGMLRSFAYAAATAAQGAADPGTADRAQAWEAAARGAFLTGYFGSAMALYLPREQRAADALLALFELEKVFYELQYELRNRPDWVAIPISGIRALVGALGG